MAGLLAATLGCTNSTEFNCQDDKDCSSDGQCEPSGFCSFPDPQCPSGRRYGELAGVGLENECVVPGETAGSSGTAGGTTSETSSAQTSESTTTGSVTSSSESGMAETSTGSIPGTIDPCPPLPAPRKGGTTVSVEPSQAAELVGLLGTAAADTTFLLASGTYETTGRLELNAPGVVLRSASGNPEDVVIDASAVGSSAVAMLQAQTMVAELTIRGANTHQIHVSSEEPGDLVEGARIYRVHFIDPAQSAVRVNFNAAAADNGELACSTMEMTQARRDAPFCDAVSGMVAFAAAGWTVRDNIISGFWCAEGPARPAIAFSQSSYDNQVFRNSIRNSSIGIRMGLDQGVATEDYRPIPNPGCSDGYYGHHRGTVQNNIISADDAAMATSESGFYAGITAWQVCETEITHNTVFSSIGENSSIQYRFDRTIATFYNNLVSGELVVRDDAGAPVLGNIEGAAASMFVSPLEGDLHLVPGAAAIDMGANLGEAAVAYDVDGQERVDAPDVGADEVFPR